ncbi:MAG: hypothetical protein F6K25_18830 [Okeania sp. SIO2G4]|uniref:hypothetical protein n=1 Tax=unclassified Okeania TaxID=2634635 RepID=UPI0013B89561|nr:MULTISPECIES: hypothetical protein [unclassified Okeania]NEP07848.1 hypothetical protein [Okeania sp. SIO4D6]NEP41706.1 hypothetical protein [Okeania sp. SIO2H7]NEP74062.1 hypothetical protein [Okeania sp. SIO2G5]NEP94907.1 hypothetical protein [Okeania sp. SIO2F5]NEQ92623.1 hypothetical protein [Okeania sp. SIO2G4]
MKFQITISPFKIAKYLTFGVIFLTICSIAIQIGKYVFDYREPWTRLFNLDREMNIPTWYSALMLISCGLIIRGIFAIKKSQSERFWRKWQILSIIFFLLALDEVASIHEILIIDDLADTLNLPSLWHSVWVIPGTVLVVIFIWKYWKFILYLPNQLRRYFLIAISLYVGGALGMEMVGSYYDGIDGQQNLVYAMLATVEEVMEMMGCVVFIYGLLTYLGELSTELQVNFHINNKG